MLIHGGIHKKKNAMSFLSEIEKLNNTLKIIF
jgi:hypothetical protein